MGDHAKYGGSTIVRTRECPPWANFCAPLPNSSSEDANRGTLLHSAMQRIYTENEDFDSRLVIGMEFEGITLTAELYAEKIHPAIEAVEDIFEKYNIEDFSCESRVVIADNIWGTADLLGVGYCVIDGETLKVGLSLDYKFGDGIMVTACEPMVIPSEAPLAEDENPLSRGNQQGLYYAAAASITPETQHLFEIIDLLVVAIVQPNERGLDNSTVWEVDGQLIPEAIGDILDICAIAEKASIDADGPFASGDHCRFCPSRGVCPATSGEVSALLRIDVTAPNIIDKIPSFKQLKLAEATIKAIRTLVQGQLEEGVKIPGFKLVPKRAKRSYTDLEAAEAVAKKSRKLKFEETHKSDLLTPPQMEKVLKAKRLDFEKLFGSLVQKVSSGTTLADEDDPREANPGLGALQSLLDRD